MLNRIVYRIRQLLFGLTSNFTADDQKFVQEHLNIKELALFKALPAYEQKHAVAVARKMMLAAHNKPELSAKLLAKIGLLHDIGKSAVKLSIWEKGILVALNRLAPRFYDYLAENGQSEISSKLFRKVFVYKHHGQVGAELLRRIGESDEVLTCVEAHDAMKFASDKYLKFLQEADGSL